MTENNTKTESEFDWDEAAQTVGASTKQTAFAQALLAGANNTSAARAAGYSGDDAQLRSAGYAAARSSKVQALLSLARAGGAGVVDDILTDTEARRILSRMARQGDPQAKVRAITAIQRMDERSKAADYPDWSPDVTARRLCEAGGAGGALSAASVYYKVHRTLFGLPLGAQILPVIAREFPEALARFIDGLGPGNAHHKPDILKMASGPLVPIGSFVPDGAETTANGHSATNGAASQAPTAAAETGSGLTYDNEQKEWVSDA